jgi:hypothetical protein
MEGNMMKKLISKVKIQFKTLRLFTLSALLGIIGMLPSTVFSATIEPSRPFVMEYRETTSVGSVSQVRLDYNSANVWLLTVVEGENLGYFMQSRADGSIIAGYPHWDEPQQISGPSKKKTVPAPYFASRDLSMEQRSDEVTTTTRFEYARLSKEQKEAISQVAYRSNLPADDLIVLKTQKNVAVYSQRLGVPLWMSQVNADTAYFEVVMLQ